MESRRYDVVVIGGGITGCAVAREVALRGLTVAIVERDDLASGTSSRSTKLLHGGLRYLEHGHLGLVRESLREREMTARLAPHLAEPLRFLVPSRPGTSPGPLTIRFGVALYGFLAGRQPLEGGRGIDAGEASARLGPSAATGFTGGVLFSDRKTDDARLTLAVARDAARRGAAILTYHEAVEILWRDGRAAGIRCTRGEDGTKIDLHSDLVVNAAGPWVDRVRGLAGAKVPLLRTTRGAHVVLPDLGLSQAVMLTGRRAGHRLFAIPWRGSTLFGTTDVDDAGDPATCVASPADVALLLDEARRAFPGAALEARSILSRFAGLRPLVRAPGDSLALSREHRIVEERGVLTVAGGKLTTWRSMGAQAAVRAVRTIGRGRVDAPASSREPLPGGEPAPRTDDPRLAALPPATRALLVSHYGSEAVALAAAARGDAARPLCGGPEIVAQVDFAASHEHATRACDVLFRRLTIGHDPARVRAAAPEVVARLARISSWSAARERDEARAVERALDDVAGSGPMEDAP